MTYSLCFCDPVSGVPLDTHDLEHCRDREAALRWLATQSDDLAVELWDCSGLVMTRQDLARADQNPLHESCGVLRCVPQLGL